MKKWVCWWLDWCVDKFLGFVETVLGVIPEPPVISLDWVEDVTQAMAYWLPFDWVLSLYALYGVWKIAFLAYRTIKKHIPTMG